VKLHRFVGAIPIIGPLARRFYRALVPAPPFTSSADYWKHRYQVGGDSGAGSYARLAAFKAEILNGFVAEHDVTSVIEFGCGDGNQLKLAEYPTYLGVDISVNAVERCSDLFRGDLSKQFLTTDEYRAERAEMALSLDVIYHLVEDEVFESYMNRLFDAAERFVVIYSSNHDAPPGPRDPHVRHRRFTEWVEAHQPAWRLLAHIPNRYPSADDPFNGSFADFHLYARAVQPPPDPTALAPPELSLPTR
jgi:hypothetical protein